MDNNHSDNNYIHDDYKYAGFWIRFCAVLIDSTLTFVILILITGMMTDEITASVLAYIIGVIYCVNPITLAWQATPGKKI